MIVLDGPAKQQGRLCCSDQLRVSFPQKRRTMLTNDAASWPLKSRIVEVFVCTLADLVSSVMYMTNLDPDTINRSFGKCASRQRIETNDVHLSSGSSDGERCDEPKDQHECD